LCRLAAPSRERRRARRHVAEDPVPGASYAHVRHQPARAHALDLAGRRPAAAQRARGGGVVDRQPRDGAESRRRDHGDPRGQEPHPRARDHGHARQPGARDGQGGRADRCARRHAERRRRVLRRGARAPHTDDPGARGAGDAGVHGYHRGHHVARLLPAAVRVDLGAAGKDGAVSESPALSVLTPEQQAIALAERYKLEYVDVASFAPDPEILTSVPVELMFRYNFLPYKRENGRLVLVMADPPDIPVVDELSLLLQTPIQPAVGTPSAIGEALKRGSGTQ